MLTSTPTYSNLHLVVSCFSSCQTTSPDLCICDKYMYVRHTILNRCIIKINIKIGTERLPNYQATITSHTRGYSIHSVLLSYFLYFWTHWLLCYLSLILSCNFFSSRNVWYRYTYFLFLNDFQNSARYSGISFLCEKNSFFYIQNLPLMLFNWKVGKKIIVIFRFCKVRSSYGNSCHIINGDYT